MAVPSISVVIPARDAARTLGATLQSLQGQSHADWQAIIIDDGSTDATGAILDTFAHSDHRITVLRGAHAGVSAARNTGIAAARSDRILFLDADDVLDRNHLAGLWATATVRPDADLIYCDWRLVGADGQDGPRRRVDLTARPFSIFARRCAVIIHGALTRASVIMRAGGFDPALRVCEDWDLWQRITRLGAVCCHASDVVARYQLAPGSASGDLDGFLAAALTVIRRGHAPDARLSGGGALPPAPDSGRAGAETAMAFWLAGRAIGAGRDPLDLLAHQAVDLDRSSDPDMAAMNLLDGMGQGLGTANPDLAPHWAQLAPAAEAVLTRLAPGLAMPRFARFALNLAERRLAGLTPAGTDRDIGHTAVRSFDIDRSPDDLPLPVGAHRLLGIVARHGRELGRFEILTDAMVPGARIAALLSEFEGPEPADLAPADLAAADLAAAGAGADDAETCGGAAIAPCDDDPPPSLPILMYHRIAADGPARLRDYAVPPAEFAAQMDWLRQNGYRALHLAEFEAALWDGAPLPDRAVLITFDDGYRDNMTAAVPVLERHRMPATIFLPTDFMGRGADWDAGYGAAAPIMTWDELRGLQARGIDFASHGCAHVPFSALTLGELAQEACKSRAEIAQALGISVRAMAYPYGANDQAVQRALYDFGYRLCFTTQHRGWHPGDRVLALPRLMVRPGLTIAEFAALIHN